MLVRRLGVDEPRYRSVRFFRDENGGWRPAIEVLLVTGVTNARTEAANTTIKQVKRAGRGYRNPAHYRAPILLTSAARRGA